MCGCRAVHAGQSSEIGRWWAWFALETSSQGSMARNHRNSRSFVRVNKLMTNSPMHVGWPSQEVKRFNGFKATWKERGAEFQEFTYGVSYGRHRDWRSTR